MRKRTVFALLQKIYEFSDAIWNNDIVVRAKSHKRCIRFFESLIKLIIEKGILGKTNMSNIER